MLNSDLVVFQNVLYLHMRVKLLLFIFNLNGGLHAVSMKKPSEQISNFWTVRF